MPPLNVSADFIKHMRRQMRAIRRLHAGKKLKYVVAGTIITKIDDLAKPVQMLTRLYLRRVSDLHLQIAFHGDLLHINKAANAAGQDIMDVLENVAGGADEVDPIVRRVLSIEAHHFIPATSLRRYPFLRFIFPDTPSGLPNPAMMPAVNLLTLEHRGPQHLISQAANQVGVLGNRAKPLTANMTTRLNRIAEDVSTLSNLNEKQQALHYLFKIEEFYDSEYPDVGGGIKLLDMATDRPGQMAGWSARDWIRELRNAAVGIQYP
jgi:hypothetical protein